MGGAFGNQFLILRTPSSKQSLSNLIAGCIPLENTLANGSVLRNDSEDGRVIYRFRCDPGFSLIGSAVISCLQGHWNGSKPNCDFQGMWIRYMLRIFTKPEEEVIPNCLIKKDRFS